GNGGGTPTVNTLAFTLTGFAEIATLKLYTTDQDPIFNTSKPLGSLSSPGATATFSGLTEADPSTGLHYYWLVFDAVATVTPGVAIDATYDPASSAYITGPPTFTTNNPLGIRKTGRNYTIGTGEDYVNVKDAADCIAQFDYDGAADIFFELTVNYANPTTEVAITFTNHTGPAKIIFRPASGEPLKTTQGAPGTGVDLITFDGVQNILFDGRPGGTGTVRKWTIRDTESAAPKGSAIVFINDASNTTLQYLNIEGETNVFNGSVVSFRTSSGILGNSNNTIDNCYIGDLTVGGSAEMPGSGIYSSGTSGVANVNNTVSNCDFVDIWKPFTNYSSYIDLTSNSDAWTFTDNHFYQTVGFANCDFVAGFIYINGGGGYTITGNYFGGTAPNAGGTPFTISSGLDVFICINFDVNSAGAPNIINGNTFSNFQYTTTTGLVDYPLIWMFMDGASDFTIGASGVGNMIGSSTVTGNIVLTNNAGSSSLGFMGIRNIGTGTSTIAYNTFGGITVNGTKNFATTGLIQNEAGTTTVDNNTLGGTVANSLSISPNSQFIAIENTSASGITITNNTIQNIDHMGSSTVCFPIENQTGVLTCTGNTIKNISTTSNNQHNMIRHFGTAATISNNTIQDITISSTGTSSGFAGIYSTSASDVTINGNTIGSAINNNITINGSAFSYGIEKAGTGTLTCDNNIIQEFNMTQTGLNGVLRCLHVQDGTGKLNGNTIQNMDNASGSTSSALYGIYCTSSSSGHKLNNNTIQNLNLTTTGATALNIFGMAITAGSGEVNKNFITGLTNQSTSTLADIAGMIVTAGTWDIENNAIVLSNAAHTNTPRIKGIHDASTGTNSIYHNTVKISGTPSPSAVSTAAISKTSTSTCTVNNNIFQNLRTGSPHRAFDAANITGLTTNFNYLHVDPSQAGNIGNWGGTDENFSTWQGSHAVNSITGTETIDANGYATGGDVANSGTNLTSVVPLDRDGITRPTNPWLGAYEGAVKDKDSQVNPGAGAEPVAIASILDTDAERIAVMDIDIVDLGTADGQPTIVDTLSFWQGDANMVPDWTDAIAGARLVGPDLSTPGLLGTVFSDHIIFEGLNIISVADATLENYKLEVWLQNDLSAINDNDTLEFMLDYTDIVTDISGSQFGLGVVESGNTNCKIDVVATQLNFVTNKPPATVNTNNDFEVSVTATD
ncbi:MAG: hypothetical protein JKX73_07630, partial [Flavobacteriales bacterium]|nr:hypothetical protein [Flavobacteriales bacterium]